MKYPRSSKLFRFFLALFFLTISTGFVSAGLADLEAEVRQAEEKNSQEAPIDEDQSKEDEYEDEDGDDAASDFFFTLMQVLLLINIQAQYADFPYAPGQDEAFVMYPMEVLDPNTGDSEYPRRGNWGYYRLNFDASYLEGTGYRARTMLDGKFIGILGPKLEFSGLTDDVREFGEATFGIIRAGLNFAIFQTDPVSLDWFAQYLQWFSQTYALNKHGVALGFDMRGLPGAGIEWNLRYSAMLFENLTISELEATIAGTVSPGVQLFGGWNAWVGDIAPRQGPVAGVRIYL